MASTFSPNLSIELIGTGDQAGTWGTTTNSNLGTLIEQAISGYVTQAVATGTDTTITIPNGSTGVARNMYIELTGTGGASTNLVVPANKKLYFIFNNSTGAVTVKVSGQTGVSVPTGKKMVLVSNGTDIVNGLNYIADFGTNSFSVTNLTASSATITNLIATSGSITNLVSSDASATVLRAGSATLTHLSATSASITNLTLTSLVISNLSIASANITTLTGSTQTLSGNLTLNGGTANGVLYLNGSKVATSGSDFTFDGTNARIGGSGAGARLTVRGTGTTASTFSFEATTSGGATRFLIADDGLTRFYGTSNAETMRLDNAGNLGIGTSSPGYKLDVNTTGGSAATARLIGNDQANVRLRLENGGSGGRTWELVGGLPGANNANFSIRDVTGSTTPLTIDSSGNLGIGASPAASNFSGSYTSLLVKGNSTNKIGTFIAQSFGTANATNIEMFAGDGANEAGLLVKSASTAMTFYTGSVPDKRMTLDSSGNLGLGVTPSAWGSGTKAIDLGSGTALWNPGSTTNTALLTNAYHNGTNYIYKATAVATNYLSTAGQHQWFTAPSGTAGNTISFTQAMTLDASGNLGIGTSSPASKLDVVGGTGIRVNEDGAGTKIIQVRSNFAGVGPAINVVTNDPLLFQTNNTERMRLDSSGNLGIGTSSPVEKLDVVGNCKISSGSSFYWGDATSQIVADNGGAMRFLTGTAAERARITSGGDLLVGTTSGSYRLTLTVASGADREILLAGVSGASNGFSVKWNHSTTTTRVNIANIPTSSAGLTAGDLWSDGGTIKIA